MSFDQLSPELILQICENLCLHCHLGEHSQNFTDLSRNQLQDAKLCRRTLSSLCLASKKTKRLAQSTLFHLYGFLKETDHSVLLFCRTLCECPELADCVRALKVWSGYYFSREDMYLPWFHAALDPYSRRCREMSVWGPLTRGLRNGAEYDGRHVAILVLLKAPQLRTLYVLGEDLNPVFLALTQCIRISGNVTHDNLKSLELGVSDIQGFEPEESKVCMHKPDLTSFLESLPRLESLTIHQACLGAEVTDRNWAIQNVRDLRLVDGMLSRERLESLLRSAPRLEAFTYNELKRLVVEGPPPEYPQAITSQELFEVLATRNDTLRSVSVATYWREKPLTASLDLTNLKRLPINIRAMFNVVRYLYDQEDVDENVLVGIFPPGLEYLEIMGGTDGMYLLSNALVRYLTRGKVNARSSQVSHLKELYLNMGGLDAGHEDASVWGWNPSISRHLINYLESHCGDWLKDILRVSLPKWRSGALEFEYSASFVLDNDYWLEPED